MPDFSRIEKSNQNVFLPDTRNQETQDITNNTFSKTGKFISLLVEGKSDKFYSKFLKYYLGDKESPIKFHYLGEKDKKFPLPKKFEKNCKGAVIDYVEKNKPNNKTGKTNYIVGIVDKDFENPESIVIQNYLECTDLNDLETTLMFFDYKAIENYFKEESGDPQIINRAINNAYELGKIRRVLPKIRKELKQTDEKIPNELLKTYEITSNGYSNFTYKYISEIEDILRDMNLSDEIINILKKECEKLSGEEKIKFCRGHDIFDFVTSFFKDKKISENPAGKYMYTTKSVKEQRKEYEEKLESEFNLKKFKESRIFEFLKYLLSLKNVEI